MKKIFNTLLYCFFFLFVYSQESGHIENAFFSEECLVSANQDSCNFYKFRVFTSKVPYPFELVSNGYQGKALFSYNITTDGSVNAVKLLKTSGHSYLDDISLEYLKTLKYYSPAKQNGKPITTTKETYISFKLFGINTNIAFDKAETMPLIYKDCTKSKSLEELNKCARSKVEVFVNQFDPPQKSNDSKDSITVKVSFIVQKDGTVTNPIIKNTSGNIRFDKSVLKRIKELPKFYKAATIDRKPIPFDYLIQVTL